MPPNLLPVNPNTAVSATRPALPGINTNPEYHGFDVGNLSDRLYNPPPVPCFLFVFFIVVFVSWFHFQKKVTVTDQSVATIEAGCTTTQDIAGYHMVMRCMNCRMPFCLQPGYVHIWRNDHQAALVSKEQLHQARPTRDSLQLGCHSGVSRSLECRMDM